MKNSASPSTPPDSSAAEAVARVLVVDDMPANLRLMAGILKVAGYEVETAASGTEALQRLGESAPDVVLLDIMMPELDGFEVCRRIKCDPANAHVPVVMVTALQETADRVNALEAGADDFLTKPVDEVEVVARVKSLVRIKRQRDALDQAYRDLQRTEALRDNLVTMLVHDLRTPLTGILAPLQMLASDDFGQLDAEQRELVEMCTQNSYGLLDLVNQLLDINRLESGALKPDRRWVDLKTIIDGAVRQVQPLLLARSDTLTTELSPELSRVYADSDLLKRVLVNLLGNAIKFTPMESSIRVTATPLPEGVVSLAVSDNGPGIPVADQERVFEKFAQVEARREGHKLSTGLGLTFCRLAVETHDGRIWVDSTAGEGSTFAFTIGAAPTES